MRRLARRSPLQAVGRAPESGRDLCSQPTMSRLENAPSRSEVARMTHTSAAFPSPPAAITLAHLRRGARPTAARCSTPFTTRGLPAGARLPCGERQAGGGSPAPRQDAVGRRNPHPPQAPGAVHPPALAAHPAHIPGGQPLRPDRGHRKNGVDYIFESRLHRFASAFKVRRARPAPKRCGASQDYAAGSWNRERRVVARLEATARGFDARTFVTSLGGDARHLYEDIYCARGQAENLPAQGPARLRPDLLPEPDRQPVPPRPAHRGDFRAAVLPQDAAWAEFATLRQRLLKIVVEKASASTSLRRAALFRLLAGRLAASGP